MAQLIVRNIDEAVKQALAERARRKGRSMEAEVREILQAAVEAGDRGALGLGTRIAARFSEIGLDEEIEEHRGSEPAPADLEE